jgi:hypothetical protein
LYLDLGRLTLESLDRDFERDTEEIIKAYKPLLKELSEDRPPPDFVPPKQAEPCLLTTGISF